MSDWTFHKSDRALNSRERRDIFRRGGVVVNLDTNWAKGTKQTSPMIVIPDNATAAQRKAAQDYAQGVSDIYKRKFGVSLPPKVVTRSQNGRGRAQTIHTEPYSVNDTQAVDYFNSDEGLREHATLIKKTLGTIPGVVISRPHDVSTGDRGAHGSGGNEVQFADNLIGYLDGQKYVAPPKTVAQTNDETLNNVLGVTPAQASDVPPQQMPPPEPKLVREGVMPPENVETVNSMPEVEPTAPPTDSVKATDRPIYSKPNLTFTPYKPQTAAEAQATRDELFKADETVTWGQAMGALVSTNWTINNLQELGYILAPERQYEDPDFRLKEEDIAVEGYTDEDIEYVGAAINDKDLAIRKAEAASRVKGREDWSKTTWGQWALLGGVDIATDLSAAVALSVPFTPVGTAGAAGLGLQAGSRSFRAVELGIEGTLGTAAEMGMTYQSGQVSAAEAMMWTAAGGVLGASLGGAFPNFFNPAGNAGRGKDHKAAIIEASEDIADDARKLRGDKPAPEEPVSQSAEIAENGKPARTKLSDDSPIVFRDTADEASTRAANDAFDEDVKTLSEGFQKGKLGAKGSSEADKAVAAAYKRQGHRLQETTDVYLSVPASVTDLNTALKRGIAFAETSLEAVASKAAAAAKAARKGSGSYKIVKVSLPEGTKVVDAAEFKAGNAGQFIFGEGSLEGSGTVTKKAMPTGKDANYEVATFNPDNPTKGVPQYATATEARTGRKLSSDELVEVNRDAQFGMQSDLANYGSSAGAFRANPNAFARRLQTTAVDTQKLLRDLEKNPEVLDGFQDGNFAFSRGQMLVRSTNKAVRTAVPRMMGGLMDLTRKQLDKGGVRRMAADQVKSMIVRTKEAQLMKAHKKHFEAFKKELHEKYPQTKRMAPWKKVALFENEVTAARRQVYDTGNYPPDVMNSVKQMGDFLDGFYEDWLDLMRNPGRAIGRPNDFPALADADSIIFKRGYTPRSWNEEMIHALEAEYGPNVLFRFLEAKLTARFKNDETITPDTIRKWARGMNDTILKSRGGWTGWIETAFSQADAETMIRSLRESGIKFTKEELESIERYFIVDANRPNQVGKAGSATYERTLFSEADPVRLLKLDGTTGDVTLEMMTNSQATMLARDYTHRMAGHVALGSMEIPELGIMGMRSKKDWDKFRELVATYGVDTGAKNPLRGSWASDEAILDGWYQMMTHTYPNKTWAWFQTLKLLGNFRYLGAAGFAQVGETPHALAYTGAAGLSRIQNFPEVVAGLYKGIRSGDFDQFKAPFARLIEDDVLGDDLVRMTDSAAFDDMNTYVSNDKSKYNKINRAARFMLEKGQNAVLTVSGLAPITQGSQRWVMRSLHDQMLDWATKYGPKGALPGSKGGEPLPRRFRDILKNAGLDDADIDAALLMYKDPTVVIPRERKFYNQVDNIDKTAANFDAETYWKVQQAFFRMTTKAIQENKWDMMPPGWDHPVMKGIFQIRSFMIGSMTSQLVNNTRKIGSLGAQAARDIKAGNMSMTDGLGDTAMALGRVGMATVGQMMAGTLSYLALQGMYTSTMSDEEAEAHWAKVTDPTHLALAAVSRSGWLGSIPFLFDSTIGIITGSKFQGYRSSGMTEDFLGNPTFGLIKDFAKTVGSISELFKEDGEFDAGDADTIRKMFTNVWFINMATQYAFREVLGLEAPEVKPNPKTALGGLINYNSEDE